MKYLICFLLLTSLSYAQKFNYSQSYVRDELGRFKALNVSGDFEIKNDSIHLFKQRLKIQSTRLILDEKKDLQGKIYTCTDGSYIYTILLTHDIELYFYDRNGKMYKFVLHKI